MALNINMARGKPEPAQLALSNGLLHCLREGDYIASDGADVRNYGGLDGLPEMKSLFAQILDVPPESVIVGGNSSLNLMFDFMAGFMLNGLWKKGDKFICPAPGYDRHFAICEYLGLEMLSVAMTPNGPDMDEVEKLAALPDVAGMWNVPVFANPTGCVYSDEVIRGLAGMKAAHPYFRLMWDNAYTVHHFKGERPSPVNIANIGDPPASPDRAVIFTSFSKVSFAGGGVAALSASEANRKIILNRLAAQTVGPDKINQLRHVRFFGDLNGVLAHMQKHAAIMRPKFELAEAMLQSRCAGKAAWTSPNGGYFIAVQTQANRAKRTAEICAANGLTITKAGAAFPYGKDPADQYLRLAPSYLSLNELETALNLFCDSLIQAHDEVKNA